MVDVLRVFRKGIKNIKMKISTWLKACCFVLFLWACGGGSAEDKLLHEAADIHMEALKVKDEMTPELEQLRQLSNGINVQGRALNEEEMNFTKAVANLESRLKYWEDNHVEVPGFDHGEHDHSAHNHDHSHGGEFHLPASDILIIQKEFRDSILAIKGKLGVLLSQAPK